MKMKLSNLLKLDMNADSYKNGNQHEYQEEILLEVMEKQDDGTLMMYEYENMSREEAGKVYGDWVVNGFVILDPEDEDQLPKLRFEIYEDKNSKEVNEKNMKLAERIYKEFLEQYGLRDIKEKPGYINGMFEQQAERFSIGRGNDVITVQYKDNGEVEEITWETTEHIMTLEQCDLED